MGRKKFEEKGKSENNNKRLDDLKIIYNDGKRILNNLVDNFKKWLTYSGMILLIYSVISVLLYFYFDGKDFQSYYLMFSIFYLILSLIAISIGSFYPWMSLESYKYLLRGSKLNIREWYEFINRVDLKNYKNEKYGLAEIILRIYYNIDIWLKIDYRINQMKYLFLYFVFSLVFALTIPLDNSYSLIKAIGLVANVIALIMVLTFLYLYTNQKKMYEKVSKWHNKTKDLDNELWTLWRGD
jgi:hypothetical protein